MKLTKQVARKRRHYRVRNKVIGTSARPRLNVYKSNTNFYAQIIDDTQGVTLVSVSTIKKDQANNIAAAQSCGTEIAQKAIAAKITEVVFDRSGYQYHGKVKAFAQAARDAGLKF